ncbi:MAG: hypothetical protein KBT04_02045 [Bacteroidales bacterium]|nr:hypothetical protein [Candidatus Colimorpha onthohippi]
MALLFFKPLLTAKKSSVDSSASSNSSSRNRSYNRSAAKGKNAGHKANESSPYFSYETAGSLPHVENRHNVCQQPMAIAGEEDGVSFDARKAIIYSTILNNPYID